MWKRKDSLWLPDWSADQEADERSQEAKSKESTGPKPHPLAVRLGLVSPALAVVATVISVWTFVVGQRNTIVGQRAYLYPTAPKVIAKEARLHNLYSLWMTYTIKNIGRTPAVITSIRYFYRPIQNSVGEPRFQLLRDKDNLQDVDTNSETLAADQTTVREAGPVLTSVSEGFGIDPLGRRAIVPFPVHIISIITYQDVFDKQQTYRWCWVPIVGNTTPSPCNPNTPENQP